MRLDTSQQLRLSQEMKLSPRIIQAMEILQLPMLALQERIDAEMQSNPVLEVQEPTEEPAAADYDSDRGETDLVVRDDSTNTDDFGRLDEMTSEYGSDFASETAPLPSRAAASGDRDVKLDAMANTAAADQTLHDYLAEQWSFFTGDDFTEPNDKPGDGERNYHFDKRETT